MGETNPCLVVVPVLVLENPPKTDDDNDANKHEIVAAPTFDRIL